MYENPLPRNILSRGFVSLRPLCANFELHGIRWGLVCLQFSGALFANITWRGQNFRFRYQKKHLHVEHFFDTTTLPYDFLLLKPPARRFSKCSKKYKKTADFLRNQRLNMVAGTGLEPAASGLWARRATNCSTPRYSFLTPSAKLHFRVLIYNIMQGADCQ